MKILFLHLGDMHFEKLTDLNDSYVGKIADSVSPASIGNVELVFVLITGDLAFSGLEAQYSIVRSFIRKLLAALKNKVLDAELVHVYTVPGNHDNNYRAPQKEREYYEHILSRNPVEGIRETLSEQKNYLNTFPDCSALSCDHPLFRRDVVDVNGFTVEINCLNSACFSLKESDDKGLHFLPDPIIEDLAAPTGANMAITLMHHSHQWFNDACKPQLERVLLKKIH